MMESLPLFLLSMDVIWPNATVPLTVFEPRYRVMIARALASRWEDDLRFGVVDHRLLEGLDQGEGTRATGWDRVFGVEAFILEQTLVMHEDGKSSFQARGDRVLRIHTLWEESVLEHPAASITSLRFGAESLYHANVTFVTDTVDDRKAAQEARKRIVKVLRGTFKLGLDELSSWLADELCSTKAPQSCEYSSSELSLMLSARLPLKLEEKQSLFRMRSPAKRLNYISHMLETGTGLAGMS